MTTKVARFKRSAGETTLRLHTRTHQKGPRWYVGSFSPPDHKHAAVETAVAPSAGIATRRSCPRERTQYVNDTDGGHADE